LNIWHSVNVTESAHDLSIARELEVRGVRTPASRDRWAPAQVSRLLAD
jgi:hypothetical protein